MRRGCSARRAARARRILRATTLLAAAGRPFAPHPRSARRRPGRGRCRRLRARREARPRALLLRVPQPGAAQRRPRPRRASRPRPRSLADPKTWEKVVEKTRTRQMPAAPFPPLADDELELVTRWIETAFARQDAAAAPDPGPRHRPSPEPHRVRQHGARPARCRAAARGRLPAGRLGLRLRQHRRRALALARAHGALPDRGRARGARGALRPRRAAGPRSCASTPARARIEPSPAVPVGLRRHGPHAAATRSTPAPRPRSTGEYVVRAILGGERPAGSEPVEVGFWVDDRQQGVLALDPEGLGVVQRRPPGLHGQDARASRCG